MGRNPRKRTRAIQLPVKNKMQNAKTLRHGSARINTDFENSTSAFITPSLPYVLELGGLDSRETTSSNEGVGGTTPLKICVDPRSSTASPTARRGRRDRSAVKGFPWSLELATWTCFYASPAMICWISSTTPAPCSRLVVLWARRFSDGMALATATENPQRLRNESSFSAAPAPTT